MRIGFRVDYWTKSLLRVVEALLLCIIQRRQGNDGMICTIQSNTIQVSGTENITAAVRVFHARTR